MTRNVDFDATWNHRRSGIVRRSMVLRSEDLGRRVVRGASYTLLGIVLRTAITIGSMAVLARLLTPTDFGYIAMATVITEFAALFGNFGFGAVLVQRRIVTRLQLDTVFWASAFLGATLAGAVFVLSFLAGWLYAEPRSGELLRVLCLTFLIGGLTVVQGSILTRLMHFRTVFWIQIGVIATRALVAIAFAHLGFGVWSLIAGSLAGSIANLLCNAFIVPYLPRLRFNGGFLRSIWRTSSSYFGGGILFYINANVDLFLVGRILGATSLGFYQNARSLTDEVRSRIAIPLQHVLFPAFSALQQDRGRLQQSVIRSGRLLAAVIFPVALGISAVAEELVPLLYGQQWLAMIPVLKALGWSAALRGSTAIATPIFNSCNRVGLALRYNTIASVLMIVAVALSVSQGIEAVAIAIALSSLYALMTLRVGLSLIGLGAAAVAKILGAPAFASLTMWFAVLALHRVGPDLTGGLPLQLAIYVAAGALTYGLVLVAVSPPYLRDFYALAEKFRKRA